MQGLLKYDYAEPDATGTAHANIDKLLAGNKAETARSIGTIGPTPWMETAEGQQTLLDMVTGSPGGAIGRVSKAAVTGGQQILPKAMKQFKQTFGKQRSEKDIRNILKDYFDQLGKTPLKDKKFSWHDRLSTLKPKNQSKELKKILNDVPAEYTRSGWKKHVFGKLGMQSEKEILSQMAWDRRLNLSRIERGKLFDKFGIPHEQAVNDPITEILRALKYRQN